MIVPLSLSSRKKNSLTTRTTHKEELEYIGIVLVELLRFGVQGIKKNFSRRKNHHKVDI
jgi:hypothetical protein